MRYAALGMWLVLGCSPAACRPRTPAAASRPVAPPYEVNPTERAAPAPAPEPTIMGPDLYFDGHPRWDPGETVPELVVRVRNKKGAGPANGPITVSARDSTGEHVGERTAYPKAPLPGDARLTFEVVMSTKPPAGTLLTVAVSYTNEDADLNPSDNATAFKVP